MATSLKKIRRRDSIFAGTLRRVPKELLDPRRGSAPFHLQCKPCLEAGIHEEATQFCGESQTYMCSACLQGHNAKSKRSHSMPEGRRKNNNVLYDCQNHKSEVVQYFCVNHNILGCIECVSKYHKKCGDVQYIPEIIEDTESQDFMERKDSVIETLKVSLKHAQKNKIGLQEKERIIGEARDRAVNKVKVLKRQMQELLEIVKTDTEQTANKMRDDDMKKIQQQSQEYEYITTNIENLLTELEQNPEDDSHELFIAMKTAETNVELVQDKLAELENDNLVSAYEFEPTPEVKRIVDGNISIGSIEKEIVTKYITDINVRSSKEKSTCWISGMAVLSEEFVVVVDHCNLAIKLIKTTSNKIMAKLRTSSAAWGITRIDERHLAVTFPDEKKIQIIKVGSKLSLSTAIPTEGDCCGIEYADHRFFITYTEQPRLQILNLKGQVLKTIATDRRRNPLFSHPFHIAVSFDCRYIYVSDVNEHSVTCLTLDGHLVNTYKTYSLTGPLGITADRQGNVYVCGGWSKTLHRLKHDCSDGTEIVRSVTDPQSITLSQDQKKLLVGKVASNRVSVYEID